MKPRGGRQIGVSRLVEALAEITPEQRNPILASAVPAIIGELKKAPPAAQAGQPVPPDPSFAFKDAAYAILTYDKPVLLTDDALKGQLKQALIEWELADFERRLENRTQTYGMEQLLRYLGPDAVVGLPKLMTRDSRNLDKMAGLVADLGDEKTKEAASAALVEVAKYVVSDEWVKVKTPQLEAANKASGITTTADGFKAQLASYQDEELLRALGSLKRVGGRAAVDFCLGLAGDSKAPSQRRVAALAALELRLDSKNAGDVKKIFDIAMSDAPPEVLDVAFVRIGEMPRKDVVDKLYEAFKTDKWKVRRLAAKIVLRMSELKDMDEFMSKLPEKDAKGFAMGEAITYGASFADLKGGDAKAAVKKFLAEGTPPAQRTTAASYFLSNGKPDDIATLAPFENDRAPVPVCETDPDCKWACYVPKDPAKPDDKELKDVKTFGDYIKMCVEPSITDRAEQAKKAAATPPKGSEGDKK
ncbi:MAG TPA: hypothetical protein VL400_11645 [Polyangiaceae bacterium]|nr:hypothetical protein [Polyangiaceae bacterium]